MMTPFRCAATWAFILMVVMGSLSEATPITSEGAGAHRSINPRDSVPWQAEHRMDSSNFQDTFDKMVHNKYHLTYVSGYPINGNPRFAAIWDQSPTSDWVARHGMTSTEYQGQFDALVSKGFRLRLVDGYPVAGDTRFAAIWDKSGGSAWVARHDLTSSEYQNAFNTFFSQGYRLKHVSGYAQGDQARYAALWEKSATNITWAAHHGMTSSDYQKLSDKFLCCDLGQITKWPLGFQTSHVIG
ncbi:hypothetical protein Forpi1262_v001943 [Fusarium oxysporum f. sp. raphani]|uniref:Uncharacterized protein n=1 Tax=Fusarium oxysporum f. sp. raphani TaxID=96318 RepID=A0A8J5QIT0_FUSOX|nr:hypothetical protein Forpi1262_v001943 [Fusarium oxysporum f. sp. raphani]